jgi:hypothetical protein
MLTVNARHNKFVFQCPCFFLPLISSDITNKDSAHLNVNSRHVKLDTVYGFNTAKPVLMSEHDSYDVK